MTHPTHNPPESSSAKHETRDAGAGPLVLFAIALVVTLIIVHWVGWGAYRWLTGSTETENRQTFERHPLSEAMPAVPPDPRLEPEPSRDALPRADLLEVQTRERALLGDQTWGWVDSTHQFARIPLAQATNLAVERGLPLTLPATQPSAPPSMPPASSLHGPGGVP